MCVTFSSVKTLPFIHSLIYRDKNIRSLTVDCFRETLEETVIIIAIPFGGTIGGESHL